jgi:hypothetical protein
VNEHYPQEAPMAWVNGPLVLYHGTISDAIDARDHPLANGVSGSIRLDPNPANIYIGPSVGAGIGAVRDGTEFVPGFYATTSEHQAGQWANHMVRRKSRYAAQGQIAVIIRFEVDRDNLAALDTISFVRDDPAFWDFVSWCRPRGRTSHYRTAQPSRRQPWPEMYELVHAPVTIWQQRLVLKDCDQMSFHSYNALQVLGSAYWHDHGNPYL